MYLHLEINLDYLITNLNAYAEDTIGIACTKYLPKLEWMASLQNIIIIKKGRCAYDDKFVPKLVERISPFSHLERLWVPREAHDSLRRWSLLTNLSLKSISLGVEIRSTRLPFVGDEFLQLEHANGIAFTGVVNFPNLRYVRGFMYSRDVSN